jgi:hypothetical protein
MEYGLARPTNITTPVCCLLLCTRRDSLMSRNRIDIFFRCDPCGARILHRPSLLASLLLNPRDPGFPHIAILHAIVSFLLGNLDRAEPHGRSVHQLPVGHLKKSQLCQTDAETHSQSTMRRRLANTSTARWLRAWISSPFSKPAFFCHGLSLSCLWLALSEGFHAGTSTAKADGSRYWLTLPMELP